MTRGRHSPARKTAPKHYRRIALVVAPLATIGVVAAGVSMADAPKTNPHRGLSSMSATVTDARSALADRSAPVTRSADRMSSPALMNKREVPQADGHRWSTASLDLRTAPDARAKVAGLLDSGKRVVVTGEHVAGFTEVVVSGQARWVHSDYLTATKPKPKPAPTAAAAPTQMGLATTPCPGTSAVMNGLLPDAVRVYEAICNNFPQITTYGGLGPREEHNTGQAIDAMTTDPSVGYAITAFLQAHASELNLYDIIYRQHIWTPVRASEGWRLMPDRGSPTANHFDHVHVAVNLG